MTSNPAPELLAWEEGEDITTSEKPKMPPEISPNKEPGRAKLITEDHEFPRLSHEPAAALYSRPGGVAHNY
jgi:hypothetical protein